MNPFLPIEDIYGTHRRLLWTALEVTQKFPVLEIGTGFQSTPYLHRYCEEKQRHLLSWESDYEWFKKFQDLESPLHRLRCCHGDWSFMDLYNQQMWGVALIDHNPGERRKEEIKHLQYRAQIIVIHDTEDDTSIHRYPEVWPLFKSRVDDCSQLPFTTAVSNFIDLPKVLTIPGFQESI